MVSKHMSRSCIILPLILYQIIFNAMFTQGPHTEGHFFEARAVSFAVFIGTILVFWMPILIWKGIVSSKTFIFFLAQLNLCLYRGRDVYERCWPIGKEPIERRRLLVHLCPFGPLRLLQYSNPHVYV